MITFRELGKFGQFGNQLFQYAGTKLYAEKNGFDFALPDWIGTKIFQSIRPWKTTEKIKNLFCRQIQLDDLDSYTRMDALLWLFSKNIKLPQTQSLRSLYKNPKNNISPYGYMQDEFGLQLIKENREKIKEWFKLKENIENEYRKITAHLKPWIGVHIRRGDYVGVGADLPVSQYRLKLNEVKSRFPNHKVFIATNDRLVLSEFNDYNLPKISNPLTGIPDYVFDFWMLVNAQVIIGGGSTFSWWASFLSTNQEYYAPPLTHLWDKHHVA